MIDRKTTDYPQKPLTSHRGQTERVALHHAPEHAYPPEPRQEEPDPEKDQCGPPRRWWSVSCRAVLTHPVPLERDPPQGFHSLIFLTTALRARARNRKRAVLQKIRRFFRLNRFAKRVNRNAALVTQLVRRAIREPNAGRVPRLTTIAAVARVQFVRDLFLTDHALRSNQLRHVQFRDRGRNTGSHHDCLFAWFQKPHENEARLTTANNSGRHPHHPQRESPQTMTHSTLRYGRTLSAVLSMANKC